MTTIEFDFKIKDRVMVKEIQRPGRIDLIQVDATGISYRVAVWDNGERKAIWLYSDEIEARAWKNMLPNPPSLSLPQYSPEFASACCGASSST